MDVPARYTSLQIAGILWMTKAEWRLDMDQISDPGRAGPCRAIGRCGSTMDLILLIIWMLCIIMNYYGSDYYLYHSISSMDLLRF